MAVKKGDKVSIEYEGTLENGTVFDSSSKHGKPLEFEAGASQMIKGFDAAVIGMDEGQEKKITLRPEDAYGNHNPDLVKKIPREQFPKEHEPETGMILLLGTPDGRQFPIKVAEVTDTEVGLDLNHPLAGKTLNFKVKVVAIN